MNSATFQRYSSDARDAAETGMTRIVGELNLPHNRPRFQETYQYP